MLRRDETFGADPSAEQTFGYQPWLLAAAALGFLLAGQEEGGLAPAVGAVTGFFVGLVVALITEMSQKGPKQTTDPADDEALSKAAARIWRAFNEGAGLPYEALIDPKEAPLQPQKHAYSRWTGDLAWNTDSTAWIDRLLADFETDPRLRQYILLLDKSALTTPQRLFMLRCLAEPPAK